METSIPGDGRARCSSAAAGVMEAGLKTAYEVATGKSLKNVKFTAVRGLESIKEAVIPVGGIGDVRVALSSGLGNARRLLNRVKDGKVQYYFIGRDRNR